jgi:hypothetical protein
MNMNFSRLTKRAAASSPLPAESVFRSNVPCGERPGEGNRAPRSGEEFHPSPQPSPRKSVWEVSTRTAGARGPIRFALLLLSFVILHSSFLHAGWVAETSAELTTQGDWNADGNPDLLVLDRATGSLRVGLANGTAIDWQEPIPTGVENATSIAFGQFTYAGLPKVGLAVTSPSLNRVQVIHPLIAEPQALVMQGLGPNALISMAGGPAGGGNLIAASTLNAEPTPWHLTQLGSTDSTPGDALLERGNEIASDFYGFIARQQPAESFRLHQFSAGVLYAQAWKTAPGVPAGADWTTGQFTATATKREYLFWQNGQSTLHVRTFDQATAPPDFNAGTDFDLGQAIDDVAVLTGTTPPRLLVIFAGGTSAGVFDFDGVNAPVLAHTLTPEAGQTFRNALAANGGDFHLLSGAVGSPNSDSARRWRRQPDGSYIADPASSMPVIRPGSRRANLLLYVGEPFVDDNARLVSALSTRDWTTAANGIPGMIQATAEIFQSSTAGLGQPSSVTLGASSYGPTHALPSQYADDVSISLYSAPVGLIGPDLRLSPPPGRYAGTLNVVINSEGLSPAMQVLYRMDPTQPWQSYDAAAKPPIAITGTVQLQAYAASAGAAITPIVGGLYFIGSGSSPAVPFTLAATSVTATSARLNASVDPNGSATTALFDYGTTTALGTSTTGQSIGSGDIAVPVSNEVTGLLPHTIYYFRAKATSSEGTNLGQRLTFTTANRPPVFADASFNGSEDTPLTDSLSATEPDGDALTFTLLTSPANGALVVNPNGSFTFTPTANYHGTTSFTVKAADAFGGEDCATITLVIAPVNDLPTALAQTLQTYLNTPVIATLTGTDLENDPLTFEITTPPAHGSLVGTAPYLEYRPTTGYSGSDSFAFRVKDGVNVFSAPATVAISISNQTPPGNIRTWVGGSSGLWSDNSSWAPSLVPTSQNHVIVNSNDTAQLNMDTVIYSAAVSGRLQGPHHLQLDTLRMLGSTHGTNKTLQGGTFSAAFVGVFEYLVLDAAVLNVGHSLSGLLVGYDFTQIIPDYAFQVLLTNGSTLNNSGQMSMVSSGIPLSRGARISSGSGVNHFNNTGIFIHSRNPQYVSHCTVAVDWLNSGTIRQESGTLLVQGHTLRQTAGMLFIKDDCKLESDQPILIEGGEVTGGGEVIAPAVTVTAAAISPGDENRRFYYDHIRALDLRNLSLSADSKLKIQLADTDWHDLVQVWNASGTLERNGRLEVSFAEGFHETVQSSNTFTILTAKSDFQGSPCPTTGQFSNVVNGRVDTVDYLGSFAVSPAGTSSVVLSDFQPYPFLYVNSSTIGQLTDAVSTVNYGTKNVGTNTTHTFTLLNFGRAPLTGFGVSISGVHAGDFTVTTQPGATTLAPYTGHPAASTTLVITFNPSALGTRTAQVQITSNDPNESTFDFTVRGVGNSPPVLNLPSSPLIVDADSFFGRSFVSFTVSATDIDDTSPPPAIATPASGSFFPIGDTVVNVSATDASGATTTGSFIVRVRYPPPLLATLAPSPVTHIAATLQGTVAPRGVLTSVYFEYGLTTSYGSATAAQFVPGGGFTPVAVTAAISNLQPQTDYHCRIVATSALGTFPGNDMPFTTLPPAAPPVPVADSYSTLANEALYLNSNELMTNDLPGPSTLPFQIVSVGNEVNCFLVFYGSYIYFVPDQDFTGIASFSYTVANEQGGSASTTVTVQVNAPPVQPYIGGVAALTVVKNGVSPWLNFTVRPELNATDITVVATSDNPTLLPASRIDLAGTGPVRRLRLRPVCEQTGQAVITLTATSLDNLTATANFHVNVVDGFAQIASIIGLGALPQENTEGYASSVATDVSANGGVVVGASYGRPSGPFIWTPEAGMTALGEDPNLFSQQITAVSEDGLVVAGSASSLEGQRGFLWTSLDGYQVLPPETQVNDVTADGSIAVGFKQDQNMPFRWTAAGGIVGLEQPEGFIEARATGISSDGSTIIGFAIDTNFATQAIVWTSYGPPVVLPSLPGAGYVRAYDVSANGSVIVGTCDAGTANPGINEAVRWVIDPIGGGYTVVTLSGGFGFSSSSSAAFGVSADGNQIVGSKADGSGPFLWNGFQGMSSLVNVLSAAGVSIFNDWTSLGEQCAISADGKFIVGTGYRQSNYSSEAWRIELPHDPATPAISPIANLSTNADTATPAIPFTLSDPDSNLECLVLTADSSNPTLVPPANIVFGGSGASRTVTVTPAAGQSGVALIVITANDGFSTSMEDFTLTVGPGNLAPTALPQTVSTNEDNSREITPTGTDPESQPLTFSIVTPPDVAKGEVVLLNNKFNFYPAENFHGSATFTFRAYDGMAYSAPATITVNVMPLNDDPVAVDKQFTIDEDTPLPLIGLASDVDGDPLVLFEQDPPLHGTISGDWPDLIYTPDANFHGADTFTFLVSDGLLDSEIKTVTLTINSVNDIPIVANRNVQTPEDTALPITLTATDPEGEVITYLKVSDPTHGALVIAGNVFTYTPDADYHGPDSFTWKARDSNNADSLTASVQINVIPVNDPPVAQNATFTIDEDTVLNNAVTGSDVDGLELEFEPVAQPAHGTLSLQDNGGFTYTPALNFNGQDTFTYRILDDANASSNTATITINVTPVNDPPVALAGSFTTAEDTPFSGALLGSDPDGDPLTFRFFILGGLGEIGRPTHGNITLNTATGTFTYTPHANYHGPDEIRFQVREPGGSYTNVATVAISVTSVDDGPPLAEDVVIEGFTGEIITGFAKATSPDGSPLVYSRTSNSAHGLDFLDANTGAINYLTVTGFHGIDTFQYVASDQEGTSKVATVIIKVKEKHGGVIQWGYAPTPVPAEARTGVVAIAAGGSVNAALKSDGRVITWGHSASLPSSVWVPPAAATSGVSAIECGEEYVLALKNGQVIAWGNNVNAVLGVPASASSGVTSVSSGPDGAAAIKNGAVIVWGDHFHYNYANPVPLQSYAIPLTAQSNVIAAAVGPRRLFAAGSNGGVTVWGTYPGATALDGLPANLQNGVTIKIASGREHALALKSDGSVVMWGDAADIAPYASLPTLASGNISVTADDTKPNDLPSSTLLKADGTVVELPPYPAHPKPAAAARCVAIAEGGDRRLAIAFSNAPPMALPQTVITAKNSAKKIIPTAIDTGSEQLSIGIISAPSHGNLSNQGNGSYIYTPAENYVGTDSFTFRAIDSANFSEPGTITIQVIDMDPFAAWQLANFGSTSGASIALSGDTDGDGRTNLEEFAFGTDPRLSAGGAVSYAGGVLTQRGAPTPVITGPPSNPQPMAVFCRRADWQAAGLTYTVLFSFDLINKVPSATIPTVLATDGEIEVVAIPYPAQITVGGRTAPPQFFQVSITRNP